MTRGQWVADALLAVWSIAVGVFLLAVLASPDIPERIYRGLLS